MARGSIEKRGETSFRLIVSAGLDGNSKQIKHTKTVKGVTLAEAETELALFIADIEKGNVATSGKMTLDQFFEYWIKNYVEGRHAPKTIAGNKALFKRIKTALGVKRIDKIEPKHLLAFYQNLSEAGIREDPNKTRRKNKDPETETPEETKTTGKKLVKDTLSPNTIKKYHILLHTLFEKATQWQFIAYNPASKVEPPKTERYEKIIYDEETTGKFLLLLEKEPLKNKTMALLALSTGLRRGEMFGLQWKHIDFEKKTIKVEQASQYLPGKGIFLKDPKNEGSKRLITISTNITALLKQHKAKQAEKRLKLGGTKKTGGKWQGAEEPENDFIFTTWNGEPAHPDSINTWLSKFIEKHDLPHLTPHSFRHMAATYLITAGVDLRTVAGKLGHANSNTTQLIYSHLVKSAEEETANKLETFMLQATEKAKENQKKQAK